jgi:hypothetical protein
MKSHILHVVTFHGKDKIWLRGQEEISKNIGQNASKWSELTNEFVHKLTGKDMTVTYKFDDLEIDIPRASAGGQEIGS